MPTHFRLAAALTRKLLASLEQPKAESDRARADKMLAGVRWPLLDSSDVDALDDAVERAADALAADARHPRALLIAGMALCMHGHLEDWTFHPRPLRDARRLLIQARDLSPDDDDVLEALLRCELGLRRLDPALNLLDELKASGRAPFLHALGRAVFQEINDKRKLADDWYQRAIDMAPDYARRAEAEFYAARNALAMQDLARADQLAARAVLSQPPLRQRLLVWSEVKFARKRYDEAWELNRRALSFGRHEEAMRQRQTMLRFFRRLSFTPRPPFLLPEEEQAGIPGLTAYCGPRLTTGDVQLWDPARGENDEDFVPPFRVHLFMTGEHLPVISEIADPSASFEGRARMHVRYVDPRTLEKQAVNAGQRFRSGQYVFVDEKAGTVFQAFIVRNPHKRSDYRDLPETGRSFFKLDDALLTRMDESPWDVRLYITDHGFDPLVGMLTFCKLCDSFMRHANAFGLDLETGMPVKGGEWRNEGPQSFDIKKHVALIEEAETADRFQLQTRGLCKFLRHELIVRRVPAKLLAPTRKLVLQGVAQAAAGALIDDGDLVGSERQPIYLRAIKPHTQGAPPRPTLELVDVDGLREPVEAGAVQGIEALVRVV